MLLIAKLQPMGIGGVILHSLVRCLQCVLVSSLVAAFIMDPPWCTMALGGLLISLGGLWLVRSVADGRAGTMSKLGLTRTGAPIAFWLITAIRMIVGTCFAIVGGAIVGGAMLAG